MNSELNGSRKPMPNLMSMEMVLSLWTILLNSMMFLNILKLLMDPWLQKKCSCNTWAYGILKPQTESLPSMNSASTIEMYLPQLKTTNISLSWWLLPGNCEEQNSKNINLISKLQRLVEENKYYTFYIYNINNCFI